MSNLDPAPEAIMLAPGVHQAVDFVLPVREDFEYGVVAVDGSAVVAGALIAPGLLAHLPAGPPEIRFSPAGGAGTPGSSYSAACRSASAR